MDRRQIVFLLVSTGGGIIAATMLPGCRGAFTSPSSTDKSVLSPHTGHMLYPPSGSYIRSGTASADMKILSALAGHNPMFDNPQSPQFVRGFDDKMYSRLAFFINDRPFDDIGVANKQLHSGNNWGCLEI